MADKDHTHDDQIPLALEAVINRVSELQVVVGPQAIPVVAAVRDRLIHAMAARDRGDRAGAIAEIGIAMDRLAALADQLDPSEATLMRAVAQHFRSALLRGDESQAKQDAATMFHKSGATEHKKNS